MLAIKEKNLVAQDYYNRTEEGMQKIIQEFGETKGKIGTGTKYQRKLSPPGEELQSSEN